MLQNLLQILCIFLTIAIVVYPRIDHYQDKRKKGFWNRLKLQGKTILIGGVLLILLQSFLLYKNVIDEKEKQNLITDLKTELQTLKNESFEKRDFDRLYELYSNRFSAEFDALHRSIHDYSTAEKLKGSEKYLIRSDIANKEFFIRKTYDELQNEFNYFKENKSHEEGEFKDLKLLITEYTQQFDKVFDPTTCCNMTKMIDDKKGNSFYETEDFEKLVEKGKCLMHKMGEDSRKI